MKYADSKILIFAVTIVVAFAVLFMFVPECISEAISDETFQTQWTSLTNREGYYSRKCEKLFGMAFRREHQQIKDGDKYLSGTGYLLQGEDCWLVVTGDRSAYITDGIRQEKLLDNIDLPIVPNDVHFIRPFMGCSLAVSFSLDKSDTQITLYHWGDIQDRLLKPSVRDIDMCCDMPAYYYDDGWYLIDETDKGFHTIGICLCGWNGLKENAWYRIKPADVTCDAFEPFRYDNEILFIRSGNLYSFNPHTCEESLIADSEILMWAANIDGVPSYETKDMAYGCQMTPDEMKELMADGWTPMYVSDEYLEK